MKKMPVFAALSIISLLLAACGTDGAAAQNIPVQRAADVPLSLEEENMPESVNKAGTEEESEDRQRFCTSRQSIARP